MITNKKIIKFILFIFTLFISSNAPAPIAVVTQITQIIGECAAFYPNIGQKELFFQLNDNVSTGTLVITQGPNDNLNQLKVIPVTPTSIPKPTELSDEITVDADIIIKYMPNGSMTATTQTTCEPDLSADADGDRVPDIVDSAPFDGTITSPNMNLTQANLADTPTTTTSFYNRNVVVRSLLRGEEFTYVEEGVKKTAGGTAITVNDYFGIDGGGDNVKVVNIDDDNACYGILMNAREYKLSKVKFSSFCEEQEVKDPQSHFANLPANERNSYWWVGVDSDGRVKPSDYPIHRVLALPEINFSGQSSYLYEKPTTKTVVVSAYVGDVSKPSTFTITIKGISRTGTTSTPLADDELYLIGSADFDALNRYERNLVAGFYGIPRIPLDTRKQLFDRTGRTTTHWLQGNEQVWHPMANALTPTPDGRNQFDNAKYAIGTDSHIDVRVAAANEPYTKINSILLWETPTPMSQSLVTSVVKDKFYAVSVSATTNIDEFDVVPDEEDVVGYRIISTRSNLLDGTPGGIINIQVTTGTGTIIVGWKQLGTVSNVYATYQATLTPPDTYNGTNDAGIFNTNSAFMDDDFDRLRDGLDHSTFNSVVLQVATSESGEIVNSGVDWLRSHDWQPLYISDTGLRIAAAKGDNEYKDYSVANIKLDDDNIRQALGFDRRSDSIDEITTFGIINADYEIGADGRPMAGGVSYAVFPLSVDSSTRTLYISAYNLEAERWERVEAGYVVDRKGSDKRCPANIQIYKNEHEAAGEDGMGFKVAANTGKCVMLAITDGGPYDIDNSVDGKISVLAGVGTELSPSSKGIRCAAIYPNIGQNELFLELSNLPSDGQFQIDGQNRSGQRVSNKPLVFKVSVDSEVTTADPIEVTYKYGNDESRVTCEVDAITSLGFSSDADEDGLPDVTDSNPFDANNKTPNPSIATSNELSPAPKEGNRFYSRKVIVRSLLRGESFTYVVENADGEFVHTETYDGEKMKMTAAQYMGIEESNAKLFRLFEDEDGVTSCWSILRTATIHKLTKVKIGEFCKDVTETLADEDVTIGRGRPYMWAFVDNGNLVPSQIDNFDIDSRKLEILPEINFEGQSSYLYARQTTKSVIVSAYIGPVDANNEEAIIAIEGARVDPTGDFGGEEDEITLSGRGEIISTSVYVTLYGEHPQPGETIIRWLDGSPDDAMTPLIWVPSADSLKVHEGGYSMLNPEFDEYTYAIGAANNINIRVAAANEEVTEIGRIRLYEVNPTTPTTSMMAGETYYIAMDYRSNNPNPIIEVNEDLAAENQYEILTDDETVAAAETSVEQLGHPLEGYGDVEVIVIKINDNIKETIIGTVGWKRIGSVENVEARYIIADSLTTLLTLEGTPITDIMVSGGALHNSENINVEKQELLGIDDDQTEEDEIVTFEIERVSYSGFDSDNKIEGGNIYVVFPVMIASTNTEPRYLSKYSRSNNRWENFVRGTPDGETWYAIKRPGPAGTPDPCPTDIERYKNEHEATDDKRGFIPNIDGYNCIMLVLADGGVYDDSSLDTRIVDPLIIGGKEFSDTELIIRSLIFAYGGAIGTSDILLLISALLLLLIGSVRRSKTTS